MARIDTKTGDDGTTGLLFGGRVSKADQRPRAYGAVDEAQAALGLVRALGNLAPREHQLVTDLESELYVAMAELATLEQNQQKLSPGRTQVTAAMVTALEEQIGHYYEGFEMPTEFVIPGSGPAAGLFDLARTIVRRAEREAVALGETNTEVVRYLNRLSDLLWTLARWSEEQTIQTRDHLEAKEQRNEGE
ncbi:MAG: cob(I)yrinic acid a,c-diamide adenosyltransferase [Actinobacteria bacterium]|nr:cob(I)yrinic acid a,c-diamide adenosyltransferase [Actinomycetota bacterium]